MGNTLWTDIARWIGPTSNRTPNGMQTIFGVVLHVDEGTEAGSESWERNPVAQVSSHFMTGKISGLAQMVSVSDMAWAQVNGNPNYLSIECEGNSGDSLTPGQIRDCANVLAKAHREFGVPLVLADRPGEHGLIYHSAGGDAWGGHPDCPGAPIIAQRAAIISYAASLVGTPVTTIHAYPGFPLVFGDQNVYVGYMQAALIRDGYSCGWAGVDDDFGPDTKAALGRFQLDHPAARSIKSDGTPDYICGPATWSVLRP